MDLEAIKLMKIGERPDDHAARLARAFRAVSKWTRPAKGAKAMMQRTQRYTRQGGRMNHT